MSWCPQTYLPQGEALILPRAPALRLSGQFCGSEGSPGITAVFQVETFLLHFHCPPFPPSREPWPLAATRTSSEPIRAHPGLSQQLGPGPWGPSLTAPRPWCRQHQTARPPPTEGCSGGTAAPWTVRKSRSFQTGPHTALPGEVLPTRKENCSFHQKQGFSSSALWPFWVRQPFVWGGDRPVHGGMCSGTPGPCPPDASSTPSVTAKSVSSHCQLSLGAVPPELRHPGWSPGRFHEFPGRAGPWALGAAVSGILWTVLGPEFLSHVT